MAHRENAQATQLAALFSNLLSCSLSRFRRQLFVPRRRRAQVIECARQKTRPERRRLNELSCAGWLPRDRGSVSGLPRSTGERRSEDRAHNRPGGFLTVALSPAVGTIGFGMLGLSPPPSVPLGSWHRGSRSQLVRQRGATSPTSSRRGDRS